MAIYTGRNAALVMHRDGQKKIENAIVNCQNRIH